MLHYAVVFLVIALIAALFGFGGIAAGAAGIAKILFLVFIVLAVASFGVRLSGEYVYRIRIAVVILVLALVVQELAQQLDRTPRDFLRICHSVKTSSRGRRRSSTQPHALPPQRHASSRHP